jgi:hypothetical protein
MSDFYNRAGESISVTEWAAGFVEEWAGFEDPQIALYEEDDVTISTVFMGINHQFGDGPPLIFETMIFGGPLDDYCWRYSTEAEALAGHQGAIVQHREALVIAELDRLIVGDGEVAP